MTVYYKKIRRILKSLVPKFLLDLSTRSKDIIEKQVPAKLKPIAAASKAHVIGEPETRLPISNFCLKGL